MSTSGTVVGRRIGLVLTTWCELPFPPMTEARIFMNFMVTWAPKSLFLLKHFESGGIFTSERISENKKRERESKGGQIYHIVTGYQTICKHYCIFIPGELSYWSSPFQSWLSESSSLSFILLSYCHHAHIDLTYKVDQLAYHYLISFGYLYLFATIYSLLLTFMSLLIVWLPMIEYWLCK